jgi:AbrB family looped-hinge helix DNA binding protein
MSKTKITTKGQVTVPKPVRERMGLRPGDELEFIEENGIFRIKKFLPLNPFKKYRGYLKKLTGFDPDNVVREMRGK